MFFFFCLFLSFFLVLCRSKNSEQRFQVSFNRGNFSLSLFHVDPDPGRLERRIVQWHAENVSLGSPLLRRADDLRELCPLQSVGRHSRRRLLFRGTC